MWAGDDTAVLAGDRGPLLLTTDVAVAAVHADLELVGVDDLGWKAVVASVSDIAAMGGQPLAVVVAVSAPPDCDVERAMVGVAAAAQAYGCPVVGGDLSNAPVLSIASTVLGTAGGRPPVLRSGARAGDTVFVTGPTGASAAGLAALRAGDAGRDGPAPDDEPTVVGGGRIPAALIAAIEAHRRPMARVAEGRAARAAGATAMIDVSDGLARDVDNLATASGVGLVLDRVAVAPGADVDQALGGGEDYELVFTAYDAEAVRLAFGDAGLRDPIALGTCTGDPGSRMLAGRPLPLSGYAHRFGR